jgi:hypothetical protein
MEHQEKRLLYLSWACQIKENISFTTSHQAETL